jgi:small subunit ribosomal protein S16
MNYLLLSITHVDKDIELNSSLVSCYSTIYSLSLLKRKLIYMLKLRLKRAGRKRSPSYRLVIMENTTRRDGRPIEELGYYNPITKQYKFDAEKIKKWLSYGVQPTETVSGLLKKAEIVQ